MGFQNSFLDRVIVVTREDYREHEYRHGGNDIRLSAVLAGILPHQVILLLVPSIIHLLPDATGIVRKNGKKDEAVQM